MHSIEDIYAIIHDAEQYEKEGKLLLAFQTYMVAIEAVDNDDDSFPFAGINPAPYDEAQYLANQRCERILNRLSEEDKARLISTWH
jgi:hypothetical protein